MSDADLILGAVSTTQEVRTCYLAAPANIDLKTIEKLLLERRLQLIVSADLSSTASTFLEGLEDAISNADLFLAILNSGQSNDHIYLEMGIAFAKERRILILAPPDVPLTLDIAEIPTIRTDITNREAIGFMLDQVLEAPPRRYRPRLPLPVAPKSRPLGDLADELLKGLEAEGEHVREDEFERLVAIILEKSGYSTIAVNPQLGSRTQSGRPDLVVWSDEFGPWIGDPLIIEVKRTLGGVEDSKKAVQQVLRYLQLSQTRSAVILYGHKTSSTGDLSSIAPPNVFFLDIHELLTAMRTKSFAGVMIDLRNRRVHGMDIL